MVLYKEGFKEYAGDISNMTDFTQFISHTIYFILKIIQLNSPGQKVE